MRIAVLSDGYPPWNCGGAQKIAAQLAEGYCERGHEVGVVTAVSDCADAEYATSNGVLVRKLWSPKPETVLPYITLYNPFVVRSVDQSLATFDPDVVHTHNAHYLSNAVLRVADQHAPVVKTFHDAGTISYGELTGYLSNPPVGDEPIPPDEYRVSSRRQFRREGLRYNPARNWANRRTLRRHITHGVAVSDTLRTALHANGIPCHETIRNGVDAEAIAETGDPGAFRRGYGLRDAPIVLFGGRTSYNKGGAHLARAFAEVVADVPSARLVVTGDDGYVSRMCEIAGDVTESADDKIVTTGWLDRAKLQGAQDAATVVATPSVHLDPFPTLNLEAFAAGTPVVTSRFGGADELVDDGKNGFVVNPFEVSALADALRRLLTDRELATQFGEYGRQKVQQEFTVEGQVDSYSQILHSVVEHDKGLRAETNPNTATNHWRNG